MKYILFVCLMIAAGSVWAEGAVPGNKAVSEDEAAEAERIAQAIDAIKTDPTDGSIYFGDINCETISLPEEEVLRGEDSKIIFQNVLRLMKKRQECFVNEIYKAFEKRDGKEAADKATRLLDKIIPIDNELYRLIFCPTWPYCSPLMEAWSVMSANEVLKHVLANIFIPIPTDEEMPDNTLYTDRLMQELEQWFQKNYTEIHWWEAEKLLHKLKPNYIALLQQTACPPQRQCTPSQHELAPVDYDLWLNFYKGSVRQSYPKAALE